jgi:hypothetical protein
MRPDLAWASIAACTATLSGVRVQTVGACVINLAAESIAVLEACFSITAPQAVRHSFECSLNRDVDAEAPAYFCSRVQTQAS